MIRRLPQKKQPQEKPQDPHDSSISFHEKSGFESER